MRPAVERLAPYEAHVVRVLGKEVEPGTHHQFHLRPAAIGDADRIDQTVEPVLEQALEDLLVQRVLRGEVVQQAGPPDPHPAGDVAERGAVVPVLGEAVQRLDQDEFARRRGVGG